MPTRYPLSRPSKDWPQRMRVSEPIPYDPGNKFSRVWLAIHEWESHRAGSEAALRVEAEIQRLIDNAIATEYLDSGKW